MGRGIEGEAGGQKGHWRESPQLPWIRADG
jgi:hypothetical protein